MEILNSIVTFVVGLAALLVYWLSKRETKRNAATIIVMDIRKAESVVMAILEKGYVDKDTNDVLHENNWSKYKHLFASDFSQDDFIAFNRFFDSCIEMQDARQRIREVFYSGLSAKAEVMQNKVLEIEGLDTPEGQKERGRVINLINNERAVFDPDEPKDRMIKHLQLMGKLSNTVAFEKLKRKAGIKS